MTGRTRESEIWHGLAQKLGNVVEIGNTRGDVIGLAAAETLAPQRFLQNHRIEWRDVGPDRQAVHRRRRNQRQFANARQSQLQRARNRRRRKRQHVHVVAHLLQALFVRDAEVLLFIDDKQAEARELDRFAEQRMRADDDIDCSRLETRLDFGEPFGPDHPRSLCDFQRQTLEALAECLEMLPRQQRRRHDDRDLQTIHRCDERGPQRHFRFAEADVAADQPVHRLAGGEIGQHRVDAGSLILRLFVREARDELVVSSMRRHQYRRFAQRSQSSNLDQLVGDVAQPFLQPRLARLPGKATKPVELSIPAFAAVARQKLDVLDGERNSLSPAA